MKVLIDIYCFDFELSGDLNSSLEGLYAESAKIVTQYRR